MDSNPAVQLLMEAVGNTIQVALMESGVVCSNRVLESDKIGHRRLKFKIETDSKTSELEFNLEVSPWKTK